MNLSTRYLGFDLPHPFMPGASPLVDDFDLVRRLEDAGAAAIVMHSLFEEQIEIEPEIAAGRREVLTNGSTDVRSWLPEPDEYPLTPDQYLDHIRRIKAAVGVPVIASLNGTTAHGWLQYARLIQEAGADALEINFYYLATDPLESSHDVDQRLIEISRSVRQRITIPIAVKLSCCVSGMTYLAHQLELLGVEGLVLFNRFYQPDIDVENLEVVPTLRLSDSSELLLRLRWLAILSAHVKTSLAASGGVSTYVDAVKALMAGAHAIQIVSAILRHGPERLTELRDGLAMWLEDHDYDSLAQIQGIMNHKRCTDPGAFERANYERVLQSWKV